MIEKINTGEDYGKGSVVYYGSVRVEDISGTILDTGSEIPRDVSSPISESSDFDNTETGQDFVLSRKEDGTFYMAPPHRGTVDLVSVHEFPYTPINCIDFNASEDLYVVIPTMPAGTFDYTSPWSVSVWFKLYGSPTDNIIHTFFNYCRSSSNRFGFAVTSAGIVKASRYNGSNYNAVGATRTQLCDGQWHHAVYTTDGADDQRIYVDGFDLTTSSAYGGLPGNTVAKQMGQQWHATSPIPAEHRQGDTRVYNYELTAGQVKRIFEEGMLSPHGNVGPTDYVARWRFDDLNTGEIYDETGNYDATIISYDSQCLRNDRCYRPAGLQSFYAIGNSLTADTKPQNILSVNAHTINAGQPLSYHLANPNSSTEAGSFVWGTALYEYRYDVLMMQPYSDDPLPTITGDVDIMTTWIDLQPDSIILVHEGLPTAGVSASAILNTAADGEFAHNVATMQEYVDQLKVLYPYRDIRRTRTCEAIAMVKQDIEDGASYLPTRNGSTLSIDGDNDDYGNFSLYRDSQHASLTFGRCLMHNCVRAALGFRKIVWGYPFSQNIDYGEASWVTEEEAAYIQYVIDRVFSKVDY